MTNYVIACSKSWFNKKISKQNKNIKFIFINNKKDLTYNSLKKINPRYIFFPHWSWIVPANIYNKFD